MISGTVVVPTLLCKVWNRVESMTFSLIYVSFRFRELASLISLLGLSIQWMMSVALANINPQMVRVGWEKKKKKKDSHVNQRQTTRDCLHRRRRVLLSCPVYQQQQQHSMMMIILCRQSVSEEGQNLKDLQNWLLEPVAFTDWMVWPGWMDGMVVTAECR